MFLIPSTALLFFFRAGLRITVIAVKLINNSVIVMYYNALTDVLKGILWTTYTHVSLIAKLEQVTVGGENEVKLVDLVCQTMKAGINEGLTQI